MLRDGIIPLMIEEEEALLDLIEVRGEPVSLAREDPGETGPVIVTTAAGRVRIFRDGSIEEID